MNVVLKKGALCSALILILISMVCIAESFAVDLFFSEYIEGGSYNKAFEIYNGTGASVDLSAGGYSLELYGNGSATSTASLSLSGIIAAGDVYIVSHSSANAEILAQADATNGSVCNFNGDDAVVLKKNGAVMDVIGQVGTDPGDFWTVDSGSTKDYTLVRKSTVCAGDTDGSDAFDGNGEWDVYAKDTISYLGSHTAVCGNGDPTASLSSAPNVTSVGGTTYDFGVLYVDGSAIDVSTIDNADVRVTGPNSFDQVATLQSVDTAGNGTPRTATYRITPPGGTWDEADDGIYTVTMEASQVADDESNFVAAGDLGTFSVILGKTKIHTIQGSGATSSMVGSLVKIEGIVVGDFQESGQIGGFFVQEEDVDVDSDASTSEGIYVYDSTNAVAVGDLVQVTGTVNEYYNFTQIKSVSNVTITSSGNSLPTAASVTFPVATADFMERYEGMLASFTQPLVVNETYKLGRYGEVLLSHERLYQFTHTNTPDVTGYADHTAALALKTISLEDAITAQNPDPIAYPGYTLSVSDTLRSGYTITGLTGVINYSYGSYLVHATENVNVTTTGNPRADAPATLGGTLKVASFNVLNYFSTLDGSGSICGPSADQDCRGADSASEFTRQRDKIIDAISKIDADIVGLMEMENHATDAALDDLISGLNADAGAGTYAKVNSGSIGSDAIKVALIYKPATVGLVGSHQILDSTVDSTFDDTKNRPALAQTFQQTTTGEKLTVVVNHLKSKGSDCDDLGDPDLNDGQGNCSVTRTTAATAMVNWLGTDPTGSGDADFLIIGDLNSYASENPISAIKSGGSSGVTYSDLLNGGTAYSYVYDGQAGYLDHALASSSLTVQVAGAAEWHINTDEPVAYDYNEEYNPASLYSANQYRASDHDPVVIGLNLGTATPTYNYILWTK